MAQRMRTHGAGIAGDLYQLEARGSFWRDVEANARWREIVGEVASSDLFLSTDCPSRTNTEMFGTDVIGSQDRFGSVLPSMGGGESCEDIPRGLENSEHREKEAHIQRAVRQLFPGDEWHELRAHKWNLPFGATLSWSVRSENR